MPEEDTNYTAKEGLLILIKDYLEKQEKLEVFNDYDSVMKESRQHCHEKVARLEDPLKIVAGQLFEIADQALFLFFVLKWKIYYLAEALKHAVATANPMSLANNARSLVEHIATFSSVGQKIAKLISDLEGQQSEKKIVGALEVTQSYVQRTYYGTGSRKSDGGVAAVHINDSLRELKREVPNVNEHYDFLCEFVHPNYGSNQLVSSGELASGHLNPPEDYSRELLDRLRRICSICFIYLRNQVSGHSAGPLRLHALLELCFVRGANLSKVFAKKQPRPTGDGKSQESAYFFRKARTASEAVEMTYLLLQSEGFESTGPKKIGAVEGGFIYDVFPTQRGDIWFKIPIMNL